MKMNEARAYWEQAAASESILENKLRGDGASQAKINHILDMRYRDDFEKFQRMTQRRTIFATAENRP